jgi:hypothetical protein
MYIPFPLNLKIISPDCEHEGNKKKRMKSAVLTEHRALFTSLALRLHFYFSMGLSML